MAKTSQDSAVRREVQAIVDEAAERVRQVLYGPNGHPEIGTQFDDIEDAGVEAGDAVARAIIEGAVRSQAAVAGTDRCCVCGRPGEARPPEPLILSTRRGDISWNQPGGYCPACRRAFFPSGQEFGHSA